MERTLFFINFLKYFTNIVILHFLEYILFFVAKYLHTKKLIFILLTSNKLTKLFNNKLKIFKTMKNFIRLLASYALAMLTMSILLVVVRM